MRKIIAAAAIAASLTMPLAARADSGDVEAKITSVDPATQTIVLDNGKDYHTPSEFNYEGLEPGVEVVIYYSEENGKRVIDDLEVIE
ncbi:DUF1344 domain-containing protein [Rhizobium sp. L1K21]|uniref:DUF1344 domain-containing protein n=1 Tax=Rhizobium sp. L1K21 TaxID=2954933 RepID=UPI002092598A|nr:DUF1344 domain-containing protein [Rhizobium sp. L1K21]MCO6186855.1 DUF1344 domain-containing protein [Rhizobium sp. L1K21]